MCVHTDPYVICVDDQEISAIVDHQNCSSVMIPTAVKNSNNDRDNCITLSRVITIIT